jgi:hypothetical protein
MNEGLFFARCHRAGLDSMTLKKIISNLQLSGQAAIESLHDRMYTAWIIAEESAKRRGCKRYGFKLNIPSVSNAFEMFPESKLVYIVRDPRDVVASHIRQGFKRSIKEICIAWCNYLKCFTKFESEHTKSGVVIRYEDLVENPKKVLPSVLGFLELTEEKAIFDFKNSKAGVHIHGHPNLENLRKGFFTTSVERWKNELDRYQISEIETLCGNAMFLRGYR